MHSDLTLFILLHIITIDSIVEDLASFLQSENVSKTRARMNKQNRSEPKLVVTEKQHTSNSSPSNTATCPSVLYLSHTPSLLNQTFHSSLFSPSGMLNSGSSAAMKAFSSDLLTWFSKTLRHCSWRKRGWLSEGKLRFAGFVPRLWAVGSCP
jgi:hypothetical protein